MARKDLFKMAESNSPSGPKTERAEAVTRPTVPAVRDFDENLQRAQRTAVSELDPAVILDSPFRDRKEINAESIEELRRQIEAHGQLLPILVRAIPGYMNKFVVVYGRRRLAAIRQIPGMKVKALIRDMTDEQAVIAQGQENSARLNPSWAETTLFIGQLEEAGYGSKTIQEALSIDAPALSRHRRLLTDLGVGLITSFAPAQDAGRRKWMELADLVRDNSDVPLKRYLLDFSEAHAQRGSAEALSDAINEANRLILRHEVKPPVLDLEVPDPTDMDTDLHPAQNTQTQDVASVLASPRAVDTSRPPAPPSITVDAEGAEADTEANGRMYYRVSPHNRVQLRKQKDSVAIYSMRKQAPDFTHWLENNADFAMKTLVAEFNKSRGN